ncbi:MAG: AMP-binding protein, partial [Pirellulales bacterium]
VGCGKTSRFLKKIVGFDGTANHDAELDRIALNKPVKFDAVKTGRDDVALLGFTSGTTGEPKGTMHFHRDLLIIADGYAREVLGVRPDDVFVGSPPLAFTFGLGGLAIFPLRFGAAAALLENASPPRLIEIIETYKATICFTAPTPTSGSWGWTPLPTLRRGRRRPTAMRQSSQNCRRGNSGNCWQPFAIVAMLPPRQLSRRCCWPRLTPMCGPTPFAPSASSGTPLRWNC